MFAQWGAPDGLPVRSLRGTPGCRLSAPRRVEVGFEELVRSLGVRLITYDRPGYGGSDRHSGRRVVDCTADVVAVADALGLDRFAVVGGSSGAHHALAVAALVSHRVTRRACVAPMAPYVVLGHEAWSRCQAEGVREYVAACLEGIDRMTVVFADEDAEMRSRASADDPRSAEVFEQTRQGLWGWIDDEVAAFQPWGFEPEAVTIPTMVWHEPNDPVVPGQHAEWLAAHIQGATRVSSDALGHGSSGDPTPAWNRVYSWLVARD